MTAEQRRLLTAAPELVVVDLTDAALGALLASLVLEHPRLDLADDPWRAEAPTLVRARRLVRTLRRLRADLDLYRLAVDQALRAYDDPAARLPF